MKLAGFVIRSFVQVQDLVEVFSMINSWLVLRVEVTEALTADTGAEILERRRRTGTRCTARRRARAGPDMAAPHYWSRALTHRDERSASRTVRRGAGAQRPPPERSSFLSIPAQTARAHGTLAQRALGHGGPRTLVRFYFKFIYFLS